MLRSLQNMTRDITPDRLRVAVLPKPASVPGNRYLRHLYEAMTEARVEGADLSTLLLSPPDILHVHWPDRALWVGVGPILLWRTLALFARLRIARARGTRIVWTVHNLRPEREQPDALCTWFYLTLARFLDGLVFHSTGMRSACFDLYPFLSHLPTVVVRHPSYPPISPNGRRSPVVQATLAACEARRLVVIPGFIRLNKNLVEATRSFVMQAPKDWNLLIAGHCEDRSLDRELKRLAKAGDRICYASGFLSEWDFDAVMSSASLVAVPYGEFHTSGVAVRALSMRRRVLALASAEMREIAAMVPSMVRTIDNLSDFWLPLSDPTLSNWLAQPSPQGLPDEFLPRSCQQALVDFYKVLTRASEALLAPDRGTP